MSLRVLLVASVVLVAFACSPVPCEPITSTLTSVCHRADAGAIAPNSSFVLEGSSNSFGNCDVGVDGGSISLSVTGGPATCGTGGAGLRAPAGPVKCTVPALAAGTYSVNSQPVITFTIPGDAGVPLCP